jgi:hypothetical protein
MAAKLLATARKLPTGPGRHSIPREIGRFRSQIASPQGRRLTASTPRATGEWLMTPNAHQKSGRANLIPATAGHSRPLAVAPSGCGGHFSALKPSGGQLLRPFWEEACHWSRRAE